MFKYTLKNQVNIYYLYVAWLLEVDSVINLKGVLNYKLVLAFFTTIYTIIHFEGITMTGERNIHMGSGNYNENIQGTYIQGNYNAAGKPQSLAQAAADIQTLLKQLESSYPNNTPARDMVVATEVVKHLESNPTMKQKVISAVKEGGLAAFEKAIDNPAGAFIVGAVKGWQEVKNS